MTAFENNNLERVEKMTAGLHEFLKLQENTKTLSKQMFQNEKHF